MSDQPINERLMQVLLAQHISEKTAASTGSTMQYAFKVIRDATKIEVKKAVEQLFNVKVDAVRVVSVKPKPKRVGRRQGMTKAWKKAYVTLKAGQEINFVD